MSFLGDIVQGTINLSKGGGARKGAEQSIQDISGRAYDAGKMTDQESQQYSGSFDLGNIIKQILMYQQGLGAAPAGYASPDQQYINQTGEIGQQLYNTTLADVKDPYASYESTLQPQLKAANDYINSQMQQRGLLQSGMDIENMGRAGVDLAIKEAQNRMQYRADALTRGAGLADTIQSTGQNNLANITNLYNNQQAYGQNAQARQAGLALGVLPTQVAPQFARLSDAYAQINAGRKQQQSAINTITDPSALFSGGSNLGMSAIGPGSFSNTAPYTAPKF